MSGLADNVKETASAPGTNTTFNLGGATAPFVTFASVFANGSTPYYFMMDATQWEAGEATLTHGSPNTLSRTTVLSNSVGTTAKLNFVGTTTVYCALPASRVVYADINGDVTIEEDLTVGTVLHVIGGTVLDDDATVGGIFHGIGPAVFDDTVKIGVPLISASLAVVSSNPLEAAVATETPGTSSALALGFVNGNGVVGTISTSGSSTAYNTSSDYRLKRTHGPADPAFLMALQVHDAEFLTDGARYPMFLAHELQDAGAAFMVCGQKDGPDMQQVDHSKLIPALVAFVQSQSALLSEAMDKIHALSEAMDKIQGRRA